MADRYFVDQPIDGVLARLVGNEAHHLAHVMRARPGDLITLFDGGGAEFSARVETVGRADIVLAVLARNAVDRELPVRVTLGVAMPKGDRHRWLIEKATELGVARLVPLVTERSGEHQSAASLTRLRRTVIEAAKQCGRNRLMEIDAPQPLANFLDDEPPSSLRVIAQPGEQGWGPVLDEQSAGTDPSGVAMAVGPEGGFTTAERDAAVAAGWQPVGLGPRILRIETAALALTAAVVGAIQRTTSS
jgi:16S rRNA (uracil1498-N3)-methyltransferase